MNTIVERLEKIKFNIGTLKQPQKVNIVAISKTFSYSHIKPLVDHGHTHFGENKVQETLNKWEEIKKENKNLRIHMVGKLQNNKVKDAIKIFDYIHSLDNQKLADNLAKNQINLNKSIKYFIQVNLGNELQKSGIPIHELDSFYNYCCVEKKLNIIGLMVIPPNDKNTKNYFKSLKDLNNSLALKDISMGMSADYIEAIKYGATYVRIGTSIFGERT